MSVRQSPVSAVPNRLSVKTLVAYFGGSRIHLLLVCAWLILLVPSVTVWRNSILWVTVISVYANIVSHWGAFQSAKAEEAAKEVAHGDHS